MGAPSLTHHVPNQTRRPVATCSPQALCTCAAVLNPHVRRARHFAGTGPLTLPPRALRPARSRGGPGVRWVRTRRLRGDPIGNMQPRVSNCNAYAFTRARACANAERWGGGGSGNRGGNTLLTRRKQRGPSMHATRYRQLVGSSTTMPPQSAERTAGARPSSHKSHRRRMGRGRERVQARMYADYSVPKAVAGGHAEVRHVRLLGVLQEREPFGLQVHLRLVYLLACHGQRRIMLVTRERDTRVSTRRVQCHPSVRRVRPAAAWRGGGEPRGYAPQLAPLTPPCNR